MITREARRHYPGEAWVEEVIRTSRGRCCQVIWRIREVVEWVRENQVLFELQANACCLTAGRRCAANSTRRSRPPPRCQPPLRRVRSAGTGVKITRHPQKPAGLRVAQKYRRDERAAALASPPRCGLQCFLIEKPRELSPPGSIANNAGGAKRHHIA